MNSEITKIQLLISVLGALLAFSLFLNLALISSLEDSNAKFKRLERVSKLPGLEHRTFEKVGILIQEPSKPKEEQEEQEEQSEEVVYYDVPLSHSLQDYIRERCLVYGIDMKLALAVMQTESNYDPNAISETGDYGLMQINASNHEWLSEILGLTDYLDERENIEAGLYLLNHAFLNSDSVPKALMVYNLGLGAASECWDRGVYETIYSAMVLRNYELIKEEK